MISAEFYKSTATDIAPIWKDVFNRILDLFTRFATCNVLRGNTLVIKINNFRQRQTTFRGNSQSSKYCHICCRNGNHSTYECWYNGRNERLATRRSRKVANGSIKHDFEQLTEHSIPVEMPNSMSDRMRNANESQNSESNLPSGQPRSSVTVKCAPTDKITRSYQEPNYGSSCSGNFTDFEFISKGLHISDLNVRHLLPKIDELRIMLASKNGPDIFGLCETFLNQNIPDNLLSINGYQFVRKALPLTKQAVELYCTLEAQ